MRLSMYILVILFTVDVCVQAKTKKTEVEETSGEITNLNKKKTKKHRSTSSSSGANDPSDGDSNDSLGVTDNTDSSSKSNSRKSTRKPSHVLKSSEERQGWRKWHRKCKKCPVDMKKKWRDYSIKWICGGYQRARRSFKSGCMMEYRNCQDGTMFVKISNNRCKNETGKENYYHGDHFFYEYRVKLSDESSDSKASTTEEESSEHSTSY